MTITHHELAQPLLSLQSEIARDLATYPEYISHESYGHDDSSSCSEFSIHKPLLLPPASLIKEGRSYEPGTEGYESGFNLYLHFPSENCRAPLLLNAILSHQHSLVTPQSEWRKVGGAPWPRLLHTTAEATCRLMRRNGSVEMEYTAWQTYCERQFQRQGWRKASDYQTEGDALRQDLDRNTLASLLGIIKVQIDVSLLNVEESR